MRINSNYQKNNVYFGMYKVHKSVKNLGKNVFDTSINIGNNINHKNYSIHLFKSFIKPKTIQIFVFEKQPDGKNLLKKLTYIIFTPKIKGIVSTGLNFNENKLKQAVKNLIIEYNKLKIQRNNLKLVK